MLTFQQSQSNMMDTALNIPHKQVVTAANIQALHLQSDVSETQLVGGGI